MIIDCPKCRQKLKTLFISVGYKSEKTKQALLRLSDFLYCRNCNEVIKIEVNLK